MSSAADRPHGVPPPIDRSRVISFTDSVFAFAITLLVLSFTVPTSSDGLGAALEGELGNLFAYLLSIAVLGTIALSAGLTALAGGFGGELNETGYGGLAIGSGTGGGVTGATAATRDSPAPGVFAGTRYHAAAARRTAAATATSHPADRPPPRVTESAPAAVPAWAWMPRAGSRSRWASARRSASRM